jgi:lysophospholipase II
MKLGGFVGLCTWMPFRNSAIEIARRYEHDAQDQEQVTNLRVSSLTSRPNSPSSQVAAEIKGFLGIPRRASVNNDVLATPVFLSHSQDDKVVPAENGRLLKDCLEKLGMRVTWKEYTGEDHWIYEPEDETVRNSIDDIEEFIGLCTSR